MNRLGGAGRWILVATSCLVVAGVLGLSLLDSGPKATATVSIPKEREATAPTNLQSPALPPTAPRATAPEAWSKDDSVSTVAARYRASKDLRAFFERAREIGGAANLHYAERAMWRCYDVAAMGRVGAEQRFNSQSIDERDPERRQVYREWIEPCGGFETKPFDIQVESTELSKRKREAPGPLGDTWRPTESPEALRRSVRAAFESGDIDLAGAIVSNVGAFAVGPLAPRASKADADSWSKRTLAEYQSWRMAMCDLGSFCGKGSDLWFGTCMANGDCSEGNVRSGVARFGGTEFDLPAIRQRRDEIVTAVKARDWAVLGL